MKKLINKWYFWIGIQIIINILLPVIAYIKEGAFIDISNPLLYLETWYLNYIFPASLPLSIAKLIVYEPARSSYVYGEYQHLMITITNLSNIIYYLLFFSLIWYINKQRKHWKKAAIFLGALMLTNFLILIPSLEIPKLFT